MAEEISPEPNEFLSSAARGYQTAAGKPITMQDSVQCASALLAHLADALAHSRRFSPGVTGPLRGANGNGWTVTSLPFLRMNPITYDGLPETLEFVAPDAPKIAFALSGDRYLASSREGYLFQISSGRWTVLAPNGATWSFFGVEAPEALRGRVQRQQLKDGSIVDAEYGPAGRLISLRSWRSELEDFASLHYTYLGSGPNSGRIAHAEKRVTVNHQSFSLWRTSFEYSTRTYPDLGAGFLLRAERRDYDRVLGQWSAPKTSAYRYYTRRDAITLAGALKLELLPEDAARAVAAGLSLETGGDEALERFATRKFEYDEARRVTSVALNGGRSILRYDYLRSDGAPERNWHSCTVERDAKGRETATWTDAQDRILARVTRRKGKLAQVELFIPLTSRDLKITGAKLRETVLVEPEASWDDLDIVQLAPVIRTRQRASTAPEEQRSPSPSGACP